jgi:hypothetical protein
MSSTLFWEPVRPADKTLSTTTKFLLRELYNSPVDVTFTPHQIGDLTALKAGRHGEVQKDIDELIRAIERFDMVHVFEGNW